MVAAMPPQPHGRLSRRELEPAFALAAAQVEVGDVPFVTVGVADAEGVIRLESFGPRDGPRLGVDAVCLLASVTKPIVTAAILREVEAGRVDLTEPLAPSLPGLARTDVLPFSAWHVLTHTTGLGDVDIEDLLLRGGDRAELLRLALAVPQETPPGSAFRYASTTFDLLAEALERRLGRTLDEMVRTNVLDPLGMATTTFDPAAVATERLAPVVVDLPRLAGVPGEVLLPAYTRLRLAGGGLWSTAGDLLRFGRAMLRGGELDGVRILSPAFVDLVTREVTVGGLGAATDVLRAEHYAVGWGKPGVASPASPSAFGHGGATGTRLWVDPDHDLVFVYLSGVWEMPHAPIDAIQGAVYAALP
jgi:CubicO group peptidase (beta-lactamase class C family)